MRTTIDLDDELLADARKLARLQSQPLARTINQLLQRGLAREVPKIEIRKGIPMMVHGPGAIPITNELVRSLLDEE